MILYNNHQYWKKPILALADLCRVNDDLGRYRFQAAYLHRPMFGMHGSCFLTSGIVENTVTWDTDNLVEDWWFSLQVSSAMMGGQGNKLTSRLQAHQQGFKFGWIPCIAREQSPQTITDYIKQRRRWYKGILTLGDPVGYLSIATWTWPLLVPSITIFYLLISGWPEAIASWCYVLLAFDEAVRICGLSLALFIQDLDAMVGWEDMLWHQSLCLLLTPTLWILDATAILSAWIDMPSGFEVISK